MRLFSILLSVILIVIAFLPASAQLQSIGGRRSQLMEFASMRVNSADLLLREIMTSARTRIPQYVIGSAQVVAVFSNRDGFGKYTDRGSGLVCARDPKTGQWGAPIFLTFKGGHVEGQLEDTELETLFNSRPSDLIILGMSARTAPYFFAETFEMGSDALVLPGIFGEVGQPGDEIPAISSGFLAYYHSSGAIVGVSVAGAVVQQDKDANDAIYEEKMLDRFYPIDRGIPANIVTFPQALAYFTRTRG